MTAVFVTMWHVAAERMNMESYWTPTEVGKQTIAVLSNTRNEVLLYERRTFPISPIWQTKTTWSPLFAVRRQVLQCLQSTSWGVLSDLSHEDVRYLLHLSSMHIPFYATMSFDDFRVAFSTLHEISARNQQNNWRLPSLGCTRVYFYHQARVVRHSYPGNSKGRQSLVPLHSATISSSLVILPYILELQSTRRKELQQTQVSLVDAPHVL